MGNYNSFLVRIWKDEDEYMIRGYVQHVGSRESTYFSDWDKMVAFITNHLVGQTSNLSDLEEITLLNDLDRADFE